MSSRKHILGKARPFDQRGKVVWVVYCSCGYSTAPALTTVKALRDAKIHAAHMNRKSS